MRGAAAGVLALRVIGAAMTYVFVVIVARITSVPDFGLLGSVFAASLLLSVLASYGQQQALVRYLPPLLRAGDSVAVASLVRRSLGIVLAGNFALWTGLALGVALAGRSFGIEAEGALILGLLIVPLTGLVDFQAYLARAHKVIVMAVMPKDILWRLLSLMLLGPFAIALGGPVPLWIVFAVLVAVLGLIVAANAVIGPHRYGMPKLEALRAAPKAAFDVASWKSSNFAFWVTSVSSVALVNVDVIVVGALVGPEAAALYFAANRIAQAPGFFQQSYNVVISPIFAEHAASGDRAALSAAAFEATRHTFWPTLVLSLALAALAEPVLGLFGMTFLAAQTLLWVLLLAAVANVAFGSADLLLTMAGQERAAMRVSLVSTLFGVIAIVIGVLLWQSIGGAVAVLISVLLRKFWFWRKAAHLLAVRSDIVSALWAKAQERRT